VPTYSRARLRLGITNVGFVTVAALVALALDLPGRVLVLRGSPAADAAALFVVAVLYVAANAPFDVLGGYVLPRRYGRPHPSRRAFARRWLRGVVVQSSVFVASGAALLLAGRAGGVPGATAAFAAVTVALLVARPRLARLVGDTPKNGEVPSEALGGFGALDPEPPETVVYDNDDVSFVGEPTHAGVVVPSSWLDILDDEELVAALARRAAAVETGGTRRGVAVAIAWNLVGFAGAAVLVPGAGFASVAALINLVLGYVVWSFVALLVLPTPTRAGVFEADARALETGVDADVLESAVRRINETQGDDERRTRLVETVFHPIPSVERRVERFGDDAPRGAWKAARVRLYLSWAGLDFLSRAVHCNVGRPQLWVMLPGD